MLLNEIKPSPHLAEVVRLYRIIDFHFPEMAVIPPKLYTPRPEHCLQFYPRDTETVSYSSGKAGVSGKKATIVGQHTILQQRLIGRSFLSIQVVFQPAALYRLTGIHMTEMENVYMDAEQLFGNDVRLVNEQLYEAGSYRQMIRIVEGYVSQLVKHSRKREFPIDQAMMMMLAEEEDFQLDGFLKQSHLGHRQFDRCFSERVGIPPKQYLQIIRFDKAFRLKNRYPSLDWLSIAIRCGYHDYQHLVKDYKAFTGYTPPQFYALDNQAPERTFGEAET